MARPKKTTADDLPDTGKVTVACKLPNGLRLQLFTMRDTQEPIMGGGMRTVQKAFREGPVVLIHGFAKPYGAVDPCPMVGGYALTRGIDAQFFREWLKQNEDADYVINDLVFSAGSESDTAAKCREYAAKRSGLEPLEQKGDPRAAKPAMKEVAEIEPASVE